MLDVERWPWRQRQVYDLLLTGRSEKQIALVIGVSYHTVHANVKLVYRRAGVDSRAALLAEVIAERDAQLSVIRMIVNQSSVTPTIRDNSHAQRYASRS